MRLYNIIHTNFMLFCTAHRMSQARQKAGHDTTSALIVGETTSESDSADQSSQNIFTQSKNKLVANSLQADDSEESAVADASIVSIPAMQSSKTDQYRAGLPLPPGHPFLCKSLDRARKVYFRNFPKTLSGCLKKLDGLTDNNRVQVCGFCCHVLAEHTANSCFGVRLDRGVFTRCQKSLRRARNAIRESLPREIYDFLPSIVALNLARGSCREFTAADHAFIDLHDGGEASVANQVKQLSVLIKQVQSATAQPVSNTARAAPLRTQQRPTPSKRKVLLKANAKREKSVRSQVGVKGPNVVTRSAVKLNSKPATIVREPKLDLVAASTSFKAVSSDEDRSLWALDIPSSTGAYRNVLMSDAQKPESSKSRLGYSNTDIFFDASILLERQALETSSDNADDGVISKRMRQEKKFLLLVCATSALNNHRLTVNENWHNWTDSVSSKMQVDEDLFGSHWECEQVLIDVDFADPCRLYHIMNKLKGTFEKIPDVVILAGGFPTIQNDRSEFDGIYWPTHAQWANTIVQALLGVHETFRQTQVIYAGFDICVPADNTGYSMRQTVELIRQRSPMLWKMHQIYFADVLSHSATVRGAQLDNWNRRKISLLLQLFKRVELSRLFVEN